MSFVHILGVLFILGSSYGGDWSMEKKIWKSLGADDGKFMPGDGKETFNVTCRTGLISMSNFDQESGTLKVGYWLKLNWTLPNLRWNPRDFNGISSITVPRSEIWVPDIVPHKLVGHESVVDSHVKVTYNGAVLWVPHYITTVPCVIAKKGYPRDQISCHMKFASWTYDGFRLNYTFVKDTSHLLSDLNRAPISSTGWRLRRAVEVFSEFAYPCCPEPYPDISIYIYLERNDIYFGLLISIPGVVVGLAVALLYLLPPTSSARIISQFVCLLILVIIAITDFRRLTGTTTAMVPAGHYYKAAMVLDFVAICWSIFAAIAWMQASVKAPGGRGVIDSILSKLECICLLPSTKEPDQQQLQLDESGDKEVRSPIIGLSVGQRFILVLDRIFALVNLIIFIILFVYLGA